MADEDPPLPTGEHITRQYEQMRPLIGLLGLFNGNVRRHAKILEKQFAEVERMKED